MILHIVPKTCKHTDKRHQPHLLLFILSLFSPCVGTFSVTRCHDSLFSLLQHSSRSCRWYAWAAATAVRQIASAIHPQQHTATERPHTPLPGLPPLATRPSPLSSPPPFPHPQPPQAHPSSQDHRHPHPRPLLYLPSNWQSLPSPPPGPRALTPATSPIPPASSSQTGTPSCPPAHSRQRSGL